MATVERARVRGRGACPWEPRQRLQGSPSGQERAVAARARCSPCRALRAAPAMAESAGPARPQTHRCHRPGAAGPTRRGTATGCGGAPAHAGPSPLLCRHSHDPRPCPCPRRFTGPEAVTRSHSVVTDAPPPGRSWWGRGARAAVSARKTFSRVPRAPGRGRFPSFPPLPLRAARRRGVGRARCGGAGGRGRCAPGA